MNRQLGKATTDDKNSVETDLKETDGGGDNDADERDDDGFLSLERQKERRKEERERRERMLQIWEAQQFRAPFPLEVVPEIIRRRIEYAERTLNAEPSGLFAAATAASSSAIGYAAQVKRSAFDAKYLSLPCVVVGPTGAGKSPLVNVMAAPFIEFGRENSVGNQGKSRVLFWTSLTPESMKLAVAGLRNSQYETGEMSTILYFKEEAADVIAGCGYNQNAAARQNSAFIEAFDGARLAESRVTTGARSADAILISAIFGVQPKPLANGFNGVLK